MSYEIARVPEVVIGEPEIVNPVGTVAETEVTEPVPAHVPVEVWKQPDDNAIPFANVEVAVEEALIACNCVRPSTNKPPEINPLPFTESL